MARKEIPWTLEERKTSNKKKVSKGVTYTKNKFFSDDVAVAAAQVMDLFEKDKTKTYTNKDIANELGLSEGTVTGVTTRLEAIKKIKIVEILQRVSAYTVYYQHIEGPAQRVNKRRGVDGNKKDTAQLMLELFEENKNRVFTKKELIEILTAKGESEGQIDTSLKVLLLGQDIKITGNKEFQHIKGNKKGLKVFKEHDSHYKTLTTFLRDNKIIDKKEYFEKRIKNKSSRLFHSSSGIVKEYLITDLNKILSDSKSIIGRIFKI